MQEIILLQSDKCAVIRRILMNYDIDRYLLVCGDSKKQMDMLDILDSLPFEYVRFSSFTPNPQYKDIVDGVTLFNRENCKAIIAVGGGSAIDVGKCIKLFAKMDPSKNYLQQEACDSDIPLIAIPTTAGTGSESTRHSVIYFEGVKQSISHASIVPNIAVLEPSVLKTLPLYQKKCTMLDALCQAIESWWSMNSTEDSKEFSIKAITAIKDNWREYIEENTYDAAKQVMIAANYAGRAINVTATTAAHAMSYKLTSLYSLPHGHAVSLCLLEVWEYMLTHIDKCTDIRGAIYLERIFADIASIVDIDWYRRLMLSLGMTYPLSKNREADIAALVKSVNPERLNNNPVELDEETIANIFERIVR